MRLQMATAATMPLRARIHIHRSSLPVGIKNPTSNAPISTAGDRRGRVGAGVACMRRVWMGSPFMERSLLGEGVLGLVGGQRPVSKITSKPGGVK